MEMLAGESLATRLERVGRLPVEETADIMMQVLSALAATHERQIIHRDLKPDNVFLTEQVGGPPKVTLLDFGISKLPEASDDMKLTTTGSVLGTPFYMSPEQATGEKGVDRRVDIYAVGVMMYECLTGQVPFSGDNYNKLIFQIATQPPRRPSELRPDIPVPLELIIMRAMAKEPAERFPAAELIAREVAPFSTSSLQSGPFARLAITSPGDFRRSVSLPQGHIAASTTTETPMAWTTPQPAKGLRHHGLYWAIGGAAAVLLVAAVILLIALLPDNSPGKKDKDALVGGPASMAASTSSEMSPIQPGGMTTADPAVGSMTPSVEPPSERIASTQPMEKPKLVRIWIEVTPRDAWVTLDGQLLPENPFGVDVVPSSTPRMLVAKANGYETLVKEIRFDKPVNLQFELKPKPRLAMAPARPMYTRPPARRGSRPGLDTEVP
jgi:serine/threonine protein kinase